MRVHRVRRTLPVLRGLCSPCRGPGVPADSKAGVGGSSFGPSNLESPCRWATRPSSSSLCPSSRLFGWIWGRPPRNRSPADSPSWASNGHCHFTDEEADSQGSPRGSGRWGFPQAQRTQVPVAPALDGTVWRVPGPPSGRPRAGQQSAPERPPWTSVQKQEGRRFRFGRPAFTAFTGAREALRPEAPRPSHPAPRQDAWKPPCHREGAVRHPVRLHPGFADPSPGAGAGGLPFLAGTG